MSLVRLAYLCMDSNASLARPDYAPTIHISETMRALANLGHQVTPLLYGDMLSRPEAELRKRLKTRKPRHGTVRFARQVAADVLLAAQDLTRDQRLVESLLRDHDVEAGYERLYQPRSVITRVAAKLDVPIVVESNSPAEERQKYWGSPLHGLIRRKELATLRRAAAVVAISTPLKAHYVRSGVAADKIHVVPNGVDELRFSPDSVSRDIRAELDLGDGPVIGFVGNIHAYHGAELFVPLARRLQDAGSEARLLIVGGGSGLPALERDLDDAGLRRDVLTTGSVPHAAVRDHIAAMDTCLLPNFSWYGSAMKLLEYAAMGKTVVAPDLENIRDVFTHGETAYLFPPGDIGSMVAAVQELDADTTLRHHLGKAARRHVQANHTWSHNGARIAQIIEAATK